MYQNENEPSLLEIELGLDQEPASQGQRFANYLVDLVGFYIVAALVGVIWVLIDTRQAVSYAEDTPGNTFLNLIVTTLLWIIYYTVLEGATGGRTLGKLVTKTKVINEDGTPIGWKEAFLRSLSRVVPFEPLSVFFADSFWHDSWSRTKVVKVMS